MGRVEATTAYLEMPAMRFHVAPLSAGAQMSFSLRPLPPMEPSYIGSHPGMVGTVRPVFTWTMVTASP